MLERIPRHAWLWPMLFAMGFCPKAGADETPRPLVTKIGVEYALAGHADAFAETGISAVKYLPDTYTWGDMQPGPDESIDFRITDRYVSEFQGAGFTELVLALKSASPWASVDCGLLACDQPQPKTEYMDDYAVWVAAVVERYDGDGIDDAEGLVAPIRIVEIGVEFSSYEPEPVDDYLAMLEAASAAAHAASPDVRIAHAAFLTTTAFVDQPRPEDYEAAFSAVDRRIMSHSLGDIRAVLDRPDLFDLVNVHALADPPEIEDLVAWLDWEMNERGYSKQIIISDTLTTSFIGWGPGSRCDGPPEQLGIVVQPATEEDRCRLADFFQLMIAADQQTIDWARGFMAEDVVKRVVIACDQGVALIDTWSTEDLELATLPIFQAGAGLSAWAGMVEATYNIFTGEREVHDRRPAFYALQHLMSNLQAATTIRRLDRPDPHLRVYELGGGEVTRWIAWYDAGALLLPGDPAPEGALRLMTGTGRVTVETVPTQSGQVEPAVEIVNSPGILLVTVGTTPVIIVGPDLSRRPRRGSGRAGP